jgi:hypothetical protein
LVWQTLLEADDKAGIAEQEYKLRQNGFRKPAEAHFSKKLTLIRMVLPQEYQNQSEAKRR